MTKLKVGDKVRRKASEQDYYWCGAVGENHKNGVFEVVAVSECSVGFRDMESTWDVCRFELASDDDNQIRVGDVYKDGNGASVRIICVDRKDNVSPNFTVLGLRMFHNGSESLRSYTATGNYLTNSRHSYDLILPWNVPKTDWSKVAVDTLIDIGGGLRYFSRYEDDKVWVFRDGATSKTYSSQMAISPDKCKIVEGE